MRARQALASLCACAALLAACAAPEKPRSGGSLLIVNARVFGSPAADAVLIRNGRIDAVGAAAPLRKRASGAKDIDARKGLVLPGFHDAHLHLQDGGAALRELDLNDASDLEEAVEAVRRYAAAHPELPVIRGRGWAYGIVPPGTYPTRQALDRAVPDRPVLLESYDGHAYWANSKAFERAGITPGTPDPEEGKIVREADGKTPQGTVLEDSSILMAPVAGTPSREERLRSLEEGLRQCVSLGITSMDSVSAPPDELELLEELKKQGKLHARVSVSPALEGDLDLYEKLKAKYQGPFIRFGYLKGYTDGVIESKTAYMLEPFPGTHERGTPMPEAKLNRLVEAAHCRGFAVALHAVGDAGVRLSLDAFEAAQKKCPKRRPRHRIEHIEILHPKDAARFRKLDVAASMQPIHLDPGDPAPEPDPWTRNLDEERLGRAFAWRMLLDQKAVLAFGSDWPVMSQDPRPALAVAITRADAQGRPKGGWRPDQAVTAEQAVRAYSLGPAYALGIENQLGTIEPGRLADLVILDPSADLGRPRSLHKAKVRWVIVDGVVRYRSSPPL